MKRVLGWGTVVLLALVVVGCGGYEAPEPTVAPTEAPTATHEQVTLGEVVWATGVDTSTGAPVDELGSLPNTAPKVVAAVNAGTLPAGVTFRAHWSIDGEPLDALEPEPVVVSDPREDAWVSWTLTWASDQPWPLGTLGIAIEVNGEVGANSELPIVRAGT